MYKKRFFSKDYSRRSREDTVGKDIESSPAFSEKHIGNKHKENNSTYKEVQREKTKTKEQ